MAPSLAWRRQDDDAWRLSSHVRWKFRLYPERSRRACHFDSESDRQPSRDLQCGESESGELQRTVSGSDKYSFIDSDRADISRDAGTAIDGLSDHKSPGLSRVGFQLCDTVRSELQPFGVANLDAKRSARCALHRHDGPQANRHCRFEYAQRLPQPG